MQAVAHAGFGCDEVVRSAPGKKSGVVFRKRRFSELEHDQMEILQQLKIPREEYEASVSWNSSLDSSNTSSSFLDSSIPPESNAEMEENEARLFFPHHTCTLSLSCCSLYINISTELNIYSDDHLYFTYCIVVHVHHVRTFTLHGASIVEMLVKVFRIKFGIQRAFLYYLKTSAKKTLY